MNRPTFLVLAAAAGALPLGLLAAGLGSMHPAPPRRPRRRPRPRRRCSPRRRWPTSWTPRTRSSPRSRRSSVRSPRSNSSRNSPSVGRTSLAGPMCAMASSTATSSLTQIEAALKVARVALGEEGFSRYQEVRAADDAFAKGRGGRGPGVRAGRPEEGRRTIRPAKSRRRSATEEGREARAAGAMFGSANYMIAFLGKPSKTDPWILQLGGHHLAINIYYKGTTGAATPYHVAAQPTVWKDDQGKTHEPLAPMRESLHGLLVSLTPEQSKQAKLERVSTMSMSAPARTASSPPRARGCRSPSFPTPRRISSRRRSRPGRVIARRASEYRKLYEAELDKVKVAYSGTTNLERSGRLRAYRRAARLDRVRHAG